MRDSVHRGSPPASSDVQGQPPIIRALRRAADGDAGSITAFVRWCEPVLRAMLARQSEWDRVDQADDLVQETLIRLLPRLAYVRADTEAGIRAWLRTVLRSTVIDAARRQSPHGLLLCSYDRLVELATREPEPAAEPSPIAQTAIALVIGALAKLPPETAAVVWAHAVDGQTWAEISETIGTTPSAAKRRFQRAIKRVRAVVRSAVVAQSTASSDLRRDALEWLGCATRDIR